MDTDADGPDRKFKKAAEEIADAHADRPDTQMARAKCSRPAKMRSAPQRARAETGAEQGVWATKPVGREGWPVH